MNSHPMAAYGGDLAKITPSASRHTSEIVSSTVEHLHGSRKMRSACLKCSHLTSTAFGESWFGPSDRPRRPTHRGFWRDVVALILRVIIRVGLQRQIFTSDA